MATGNDATQLKLCLTKIIKLAHECLEKLTNNRQGQQPPQSQAGTSSDNLLINSLLNNNIYTFTLSNDENELPDRLTTDIETTLDQHLPHLSQIGFNYLLDFLHSYHYDSDTRKFTSPLTIQVLHSFHRELKGLLAASDAFPAARDGQLEVVKDFIVKYPTFKDKPGLWRTTLLFSAARNNQVDIVKYLIEQAHCSVNAQNQRDMSYALNPNAMNFTPRPTAASTALHGACYYNHLNVVKYLVEHGADYFIKNQAYETPIMNGERHLEITQYFQNHLLTSYSIKPPAHLPDQPTMNDDKRPIKDCAWEYKPIADHGWYSFSPGEANELHQALIPSKEFKQQVYLRVPKGFYTVSMIEFLRSGNNSQDSQKNMAWIRCRGSSVLNFDSYSIWQLMLIKHPKRNNNTKDTPSLKIDQLPTMFNSRFKTPVEYLVHL